MQTGIAIIAMPLADAGKSTQLKAVEALNSEK
jgi:hypothetical protein